MQKPKTRRGGKMWAINKTALYVVVVLMVILEFSLLFADSNVGFPPFYLGMSLPEVEDILGKPDTMLPSMDSSRMNYFYKENGLAFSFDAWDVTSNEDFKLLSIIIMKRSEYGTRKGIKAGDPMSVVKKLYGKPSRTFTKMGYSHLCYDVAEASLDFAIFKGKSKIDMIMLDATKQCSEENTSESENNSGQAGNYKYYIVIAGSFTENNQAVSKLKKIQTAGFSGKVELSENYEGLREGYYIIVVKDFLETKQNASTLVSKLKKAGFDAYFKKHGKYLK